MTYKDGYKKLYYAIFDTLDKLSSLAEDLKVLQIEIEQAIEDDDRNNVIEIIRPEDNQGNSDTPKKD